MKKNSTLFKKKKTLLIFSLIIIVLNTKTYCQNYLTNVTNTPVTYNTCGGIYYDNGGAAGDYTVSVNNRITTFCSNDGNSIKIDFTQFNIEFSYDKLYIYDGPTTASPLIVLLSGNISPGSFISTGTCLTFKFYSDGFYAYPGWKALITCVVKPPCVSNPAAANLCANATYITNLNGYCGNTSASYSPDSSPDLLTDFCGSIENNSWLKFTASETTAIFNVWTSNCLNGDGIQIQIFSTTNCLTFNPVSNCWNQMYDENSTITATGLTIGQDYYMMIDGNGGDVCDYLIGGVSGMILLPLDNVEISVNCLNSKAQLQINIEQNTNLIYYNIEKSTDGINFETISKNNSISSNYGRLMYFFNDENSTNLSAYYRLNFTDYNGIKSMSDIVSFNCKNSDFEFFPNASNSTFNVKCYSDDDCKKSIQLYNSCGQIILNNEYFGQNMNEIIDVSHLECGMYSMHFSQKDTKIIEKFIKL